MEEERAGFGAAELADKARPQAGLAQFPCAVPWRSRSLRMACARQVLGARGRFCEFRRGLAR